MISVEKRNKPAVALVNFGFLNDALCAASSKGVPGLRILPEPIAAESLVQEQIETGIASILDKIVSDLTRPLTEAEKAPVRESSNTSRMIFEGTLDEVNLFYYKRGWTDGFPIIPPTEEKVAEMLKGTDLPPDHVVTTCLPRLGKATVEKIAINAVMAGALPTYMPILISGVKGLDEDGYFRGLAVSAGSWAPCYMVNGPIRNELNINNGAGVMSPGNIANATIGRAMGLIVKNIGGIRKGMEDMGTMGNPGKYTMVLAENEEESPWEPLHVQAGFEKNDNVISIFFPCSVLMMLVYGTDDISILRTYIYNVPPRRDGTTCIIMNPQHAGALAKAGWTKKDIVDFVCEYARAPISHLPFFWGAWGGTPNKSVKGMAGQKGMLLSPNDSPQDTARILRNPDLVKVFVMGGPGADTGMLMGQGRWITKKVELPADWNNLVKKYGNIVPTYARY
jgi:hypothetical protein